MTVEIKAIQFLRTIAGAETDVKIERPTNVARLPRYLLDFYNLRDGTIFGVPVIFAMTRTNDDSVRSIDLRRQAALLKRATQREPVFVLERIRGDTARRLIEAQIAFVEVDRQVYLPFILLQLHAKSDKSPAVPRSNELGGWAQGILTRQLIDQDLGDNDGSEIARRLGVSKMVTSRALAQLLRAKLCSSRNVGSSKIIEFPTRAELWRLARKHLRSPVTSVIGLDHLPEEISLVTSGETALAARTMLAEPRITTYAVDAKSARRQISRWKAQHEPAYYIELWSRDPKITAHNGLVDPISLALILEEEPDERVQSALDDMMSSISLPLKARIAP